MKNPVSKNDFCLVLCCALSVSVISGVVFWLDTETPAITSDVALSQAEEAANQVCAESGMARCDYRLVDATMEPATKTDTAERWHFDFYSPKSGHMSVKVMESGDMAVDAAETKGTISRAVQ